MLIVLMFVAAEARMGRYIYEKRFHNIPLNSFITVPGKAS